MRETSVIRRLLVRLGIVKPKPPPAVVVSSEVKHHDAP